MDYTERELNFLLTNHQKFGLKVISDKLGRSLAALETKMKRLGIKASRKCNATKEELVNAWFDGKDIVMKDPIHGVEDWVSVRHPDFWSYLGQFCVNVDKYKIL